VGLLIRLSLTLLPPGLEEGDGVPSFEAWAFSLAWTLKIGYHFAMGAAWCKLVWEVIANILR
jgi:hypothetical protein